MKYTPDCTRMNNNTPTAPLHGVDFSGSQEVDGRNDKIWIASWLPGQRFIQLNSGGDYPGFDRKMLSTKIIDGSGTWVIDFPFGPPNAVAEAAGWNTWKAYIAWCGSHPDPVVLRDQLRKDCQIAGLVIFATGGVDSESTMRATKRIPVGESVSSRAFKSESVTN